MIGGFEDPTAGRVFLGGDDVTQHPPYKRDVNTVFQSYALFPHLSVEKNVCFGLERKKVGKAEAQARVGEALEMVQLGGLGKRKPPQLSGGQQQRVALARALVNRPARAAARRAARRARPAPAQAAADRAQAHPAGRRHHLRARDARPGGGHEHGRHDRGHERGPDRAGRIGRRPLRGPRTEFVANFLGVSNLIDAQLTGRRRRRLAVETHDGADAARADGPDRPARPTTSASACGPEKITLCPPARRRRGHERAPGHVVVASFLGVSIQYVVRAAGGRSSPCSPRTREGRARGARRGPRGPALLGPASTRSSSPRSA